MVGGANKECVAEEEVEEVAFEPTLLLKGLKRRELGKRALLEAEGVDMDVEGEGGFTPDPRTLRSSGLSESKEFALCLKSSVRMSLLRRSMGEPLDSEYSTPKWRRWALAWLDRPLRVSNHAPHNLHMMSLLGSASIAMRNRGEQKY